MAETFWNGLDSLVDASTVCIDRPRGSAHPRDASFIYPLDYGFLDGTRSGDAGGIDVWIGTGGAQAVTGVVCTVDTDKRDAEVKLLLGCTPEEAEMICRLHNQGRQSAVLLLRSDGSG